MASEVSYFSKVIDDDSNPDGWTPLLWASSKGNLETVVELVNLGANPYKTKKDGLTALHIAASNNDIHLLDFLIDRDFKIDLDVKNEDGWTPSHLAGFLNNFDALNLLLEKGANISSKNNNDLTCY